MPKKPARNAFYLYVQDYKQEQMKKGVNFKNLAEAFNAAGPAWQNATEAVRAKYEQMAKKEKEKNNVPEKKYTSQGVPLSVIEQQEREAREAEEMQIKDIRNIVKLKAFNESINFEQFYVMDVNYYCQVNTEYVICESSILRFSLADGIINEYHEIVNPGSIPFGYASDAKIACEELGVVSPDENPKRSDYIKILANIMEYLNVKVINVQTALPPIFTHPDKVEAVQSFIQQLCIRAAQDDTLFRIYRLDKLFFTLINSIKTRDDEGFPKESLALTRLNADLFKYTPGISCEHHEQQEDKAVQCTLSRVKRWTYTVLDHCCPIVGIEMKPGRHLPVDFDVQAVETFKEEKKKRAGPSVAAMGNVSCSSSVISESMNSSTPWNTTGEGSSVNAPTNRIHKPLRMPKTDYTKNFRQAPDLSEDNFPALSLGKGRGRGLAPSMNRLNLN